MNRQLYEELKKITPEEARILSGDVRIDSGLYTTDADGEIRTVEAKQLMESGRLIDVRKHTRFVHFPAHTHDYVEMIYMCAGSTRQIINGREVLLQQGELLLLSQQAKQEIFPAKEEDIAVNFLILPAFFDYVLRMTEEDPNTLREFVVDCLKSDAGDAGYMHFKVADVLPVQNLAENLIWSIKNRQPNRRGINQITMSLLFLQLMNHTDKMETDISSSRQLALDVLRYVEEHYRDGELKELAETLHYDISWLSREIKRQTGGTFTELLQKKRLNQAAYLLTHTGMSVLEIAMAVGYENVSYFHRLFQKQYEMTPRQYRLEAKAEVLSGRGVS